MPKVISATTTGLIVRINGELAHISWKRWIEMEDQEHSPDQESWER